MTTMMKKYLSIMAAAVILAACGNSKEKSTTTDQKDVASADASAKTYKVVTDQTQLNWTGKKVTGQHHGTVTVSGGELSVKDGNIQAGSFTIDMKSIKDVDLTDAEMNQKLTGHLLSPDFFHADSFPTAKFEISSVTPKTDDKGNTHEVAGNLTIKGITRNISFPAKVKTEGDKLVADATFTIDRTDWGIKYGSGKFFKDLADKTINDLIEFELHLTAQK